MWFHFFLIERCKYHILKLQSLYLMRFWSYGLYIYCCKFAARPEIELNTESSKINEPHKLRFTLADNLNLKDSNRNTALTNVSIYCTWKNIKSEYNNNKFKVSVAT